MTCDICLGMGLLDTKYYPGDRCEACRGHGEVQPTADDLVAELARSLTTQTLGHGVLMTEEQARAIAANLATWLPDFMMAELREE